MEIYLLGCFITLIIIAILIYLDYKTDDNFVFTVKELLTLIVFVILSYVGTILVLIAFIDWLIKEKGNKIIFKKK